MESSVNKTLVADQDDGSENSRGKTDKNQTQSQRRASQRNTQGKKPARLEMTE
jgi:hypothetical protein